MYFSWFMYETMCLQPFIILVLNTTVYLSGCCLYVLSKNNEIFLLFAYKSLHFCNVHGFRTSTLVLFSIKQTKSRYIWTRLRYGNNVFEMVYFHSIYSLNKDIFVGLQIIHTIEHIVLFIQCALFTTNQESVTTWGYVAYTILKNVLWKAQAYIKTVITRTNKGTG